MNTACLVLALFGAWRCRCYLCTPSSTEDVSNLKAVLVPINSSLFAERTTCVQHERRSVFMFKQISRKQGPLKPAVSCVWCKHEIIVSQSDICHVHNDQRRRSGLPNSLVLSTSSWHEGRNAANISFGLRLTEVPVELTSRARALPLHEHGRYSWKLCKNKR